MGGGRPARDRAPTGSGVRDQPVPGLGAYEIDGGPGGIYWEVGADADQETIGVVSTRREAEALGASVFHTLAEWEAKNAELEADREDDPDEVLREAIAQSALVDPDGSDVVHVPADPDGIVLQNRGAFARCGECDEILIWHTGPTFAGWRATNLHGHLIDICYRVDNNAWVGHAPTEVK